MTTEYQEKYKDNFICGVTNTDFCPCSNSDEKYTMAERSILYVVYSCSRPLKVSYFFNLSIDDPEIITKTIISLCGKEAVVLLDQNN